MGSTKLNPWDKSNAKYSAYAPSLTIPVIIVFERGLYVIGSTIFPENSTPKISEDVVVK